MRLGDLVPPGLQLLVPFPEDLDHRLIRTLVEYPNHAVSVPYRKP